MVRIDLKREEVTRTLEAAIASLKRSAAKGQNPMIKKIIDEDIARYQNALNTLAEIK